MRWRIVANSGVEYSHGLAQPNADQSKDVAEAKLGPYGNIGAANATTIKTK
jgi:hypothetical protein